LIHFVSILVLFGQLSQISSKIAFFNFVNTIYVTLWITGFLCVLNIGLALFYRKRQVVEVMSYYVACGVELAIFVFVLVLHLGLISHVPYPLPPGLPFDRAEIGGTLAIAIGLFPATYWHRTSFSDVGVRMAQDAKTMKDRDGGVRVEQKSTPGEWMN